MKVSNSLALCPSQLQFALECALCGPHQAGTNRRTCLQHLRRCGRWCLKSQRPPRRRCGRWELRLSNGKASSAEDLVADVKENASANAEAVTPIAGILYIGDVQDGDQEENFKQQGSPELSNVTCMQWGVIPVCYGVWQSRELCLRYEVLHISKLLPLTCV